MQRSKSFRTKCVRTLLMLLPLVWLAGCGGSSTASSVQEQSASVFTVGTDSPALPSVVSAQFTINSVTLTGSGGTTGNLLSQPATVDFAKLSGLHELEDLNPVPLGSYTSATITFAPVSATPPLIQYIDVTQTPPALNTLSNPTLSQMTVNVTITKPFTLTANDLVGFRMEFELGKSLATDSNGNLTGVINPTFKAQLLNATDSNVSIDDFRGGVVGITGNNTFVLQGPHGRQWNVTVNNSTAYDTGEQMGSWTTDGNTIVEVSGQLDPVTHAIDASEVAVISVNKFVFGGLLTYVNPPPPAAATRADLYIRDELPDVSGLEPGQITSFTLDGGEKYSIAHVPLPLTTLLFNNNALAAGQRVAIGGTVTTVGTTTTLTPKRIILQPQGQAGPWVVSSTIIQSGNIGSFQFTDNTTAGVLLPTQVTVMTTSQTRFIDLSGLSALSGTQAIPLRVVGLILINPLTEAPVMIARSVEELSD